MGREDSGQDSIPGHPSQCPSHHSSTTGSETGCSHAHYRRGYSPEEAHVEIVTPRQKSWSVCVLYAHCTTTQDSHYRSLRSSLSFQSCNNIEICGDSPSYELEPWQKAPTTTIVRIGSTCSITW